MWGGEWEPCILAYVPQFKYLGSMVEGGHRTTSEIAHRLALGRTAMKAHGRFFRSTQASLAHKLQAYRVYGVSVVMQGFAGWHLSTEALRMLAHFDLGAQAKITGWDREIVARKCTFSLTSHIRVRRLELLARTLELPTTALPQRMLKALHQHIEQSDSQEYRGTIFMDVPRPADLEHTIALIADGERWAKWKAGKQWEQRYGQKQTDIGRHTRSRGTHEEGAAGGP